MRRTFILAVIMAMVLGFSMQAHATLELRGMDVNGNRLIYDTDFNITWYDYTNSSDWQNQLNWASALSVSGGDLVGVYDDWRLPTALNQNGTGPCTGYSCTGSEMGHLYYTELGNSTSSSLTETGDFQHLQLGFYWSSTEYAALASNAWYFYTDDGSQLTSNKGFPLYAIAVRSGDVSVAVVPEPMSMVLFGVGAAVFGARRMVIRRRG